MPFRPRTVVQEQIPAGLAHSPDVDAWDDLLRSQGIRMVHYRAMECPFGLADKDDAMRRIHPQHAGCSRGFLYDRAGDVVVLASGNTQSTDQQDPGLLDGSTLSATFARFYEPREGREYADCDAVRVFVSPFDRLFLAEEAVLWPHWERVERSPLDSDRLRFPAVSVQRLVDADLVEYREGDFGVSADGRVVWSSDRRPPPETVYCVRYLYRPYWYVQRLGHAVRTVQVQGADGNRKVQRLPFQATLVKEQVFEESDRPAPGAEVGIEVARAPRDGGFPAR